VAPWLRFCDTLASCLHALASNAHSCPTVSLRWGYALATRAGCPRNHADRLPGTRVRAAARLGGTAACAAARLL